VLSETTESERDATTTSDSWIKEKQINVLPKSFSKSSGGGVVVDLKDSRRLFRRNLFDQSFFEFDRLRIVDVHFRHKPVTNWLKKSNPNFLLGK